MELKIIVRRQRVGDGGLVDLGGPVILLPFTPFAMRARACARQRDRLASAFEWHSEAKSSILRALREAGASWVASVTSTQENREDVVIIVQRDDDPRDWTPAVTAGLTAAGIAVA